MRTWHSIAVLGVLASTPAFAQSADEDAADQELAKAEELVQKEQYERAQRLYEKLAEDYPETQAGRLAAQRSQTNSLLGWVDLLRHGPSENRVDIVLMGDGYLLKKQNPFDDLAKDVPRTFERDTVFGEYFGYLNFIKANVVSEEDGIDGYGRDASTALGGSILGAGDYDRVGVDPSAVRSVLDRIDGSDGYALVFVPKGELGSGGDGIAAIGGAKPEPRMIIHEWGHAFGSLKDEYTTYSGYRGEVTSWINVSDTEDPERVPWKHFLEAKVRGVGIYEGADGRVRDAWKPTASGCKMETGDSFCPVCREALVLHIYELVDPIENHTPALSPEEALSGSDPHVLRVQVLEPTDHRLQVQWWVFPEDEAPRPGGDPASRPRRKRGPLVEIGDKPAAETHGKGGLHEFKVVPKDLEPGRYRVVCRVRDTTEIRGEKYPWVIKDEHGVLESERGWWVEVPE